MSRNGKAQQSRALSRARRASSGPCAEAPIEVPVRGLQWFLSSEVKLDGIDATQNFIVDTGGQHFRCL
ncbi:MAG: hypothetical protein WKF84_08085 [Pyrinomonadaceae bacterium]